MHVVECDAMELVSQSLVFALHPCPSLSNRAIVSETKNPLTLVVTIIKSSAAHYLGQRMNIKFSRVQSIVKYAGFQEKDFTEKRSESCLTGYWQTEDNDVFIRQLGRVLLSIHSNGELGFGIIDNKGRVVEHNSDVSKVCPSADCVQ